MEPLRILAAFGGTALVLLVALDVLQTTLLLHGGGPLATRLSDLLWRGALRRWGGRNHERLSVIGPQILLVTIAVWAILFWVGWSLLFAAEPGAVLVSKSGAPADSWGRIYFAGYTLITLGIGDYKPGGPLWQMLTVVASASGFFFVTLVITYAVPLVSAVVQERQLAAQISSLGHSAEEILDGAWNGHDCTALSNYLDSIAPQVNQLAQQHLAYPVLHTFHSRRRETGIAPSLAALDEALTLLEQLPARYCPNCVSCRVFRRTLELYLHTLEQHFMLPAEQPPPAPPASALAPDLVGAPDANAVERAYAAVADRRRLLLAMVRRHGWRWEDVEPVPQR